MKEIIGYVFGEAAKSNIEKRKVGCVIVDSSGQIIGKGFNTVDNHAEREAILSFNSAELYPEPSTGPVTAYVSHEPCPDCASALLIEFGQDTKIEVVKEFMKFDGDKTRYDLVPPSAMKAMAEVITFGARKYKPNNWKTCEEPERYIGAAYRHIEAWRAGEAIDQDSGFHHLAHALTNLAYLLDLGYNPTNWSDKDGESN